MKSVVSIKTAHAKKKEKKKGKRGARVLDGDHDSYYCRWVHCSTLWMQESYRSSSEGPLWKGQAKKKKLLPINYSICGPSNKHSIPNKIIFCPSVFSSSVFFFFVVFFLLCAFFLYVSVWLALFIFVHIGIWGWGNCRPTEEKKSVPFFLLSCFRHLNNIWFVIFIQWCDPIRCFLKFPPRSFFFPRFFCFFFFTPIRHVKFSLRRATFNPSSVPWQCAGMCTVNFTIWWNYSELEANRRILILSSWGTMSIVDTIVWKQWPCYWRWR